MAPSPDVVVTSMDASGRHLQSMNINVTSSYYLPSPVSRFPFPTFHDPRIARTPKYPRVASASGSIHSSLALPAVMSSQTGVVAGAALCCAVLLCAVSLMAARHIQLQKVSCIHPNISHFTPDRKNATMLSKYSGLVDKFRIFTPVPHLYDLFRYGR